MSIQSQVLEKLASARGVRSEEPNIELAKQIAGKKDKEAVQILAEHLSDRSKDIRYDCIKVLYETGERVPALIAPYTELFTTLLLSTDNRMQWGAMTALGCLVKENPKVVFQSLPLILTVAEKGSVITKDQAVMILIGFCEIKAYQATAFPLLIEQLKKAPENQLPMYAERAAGVVNPQNKQAFIRTLTARLPDLEKDTKRLRIEKVIRKLSG